MSPRVDPRAAFVAALLALAGAGALEGQVADPDPQRYAETFEDWATSDAENSLPSDPIVFVGSSSINYWRTAEAFPGLPVVNRGFGGSQASDALHWVEQAVLKYDPSVVVYYEGDNDVAAGKSAQQIVEDMRAFARAVHAANPATQIVFLSVKPSLRRWEMWPQSLEVNALLKEMTAGEPNTHYVDVASPMLGTDGEPIPSLFIEDGLHMNATGYALWNGIVGPLLVKLTRAHASAGGW
ncbi:MAG TPA: SGNH/GDSL hydrolase family protein [Longimicrobiales bacterium]|nr:SGNH/GDSL hydrolase family protein [Longimicrobiales bacterium]